MGMLKVVIPDNIEMRFRKTAMGRFRYAKGALSEAAQQALDRWCSQEELIPEEIILKNPVEAIRGMLKHVKKTSVGLQHELSKIRSEKYVNA